MKAPLTPRTQVSSQQIQAPSPQVSAGSFASTGKALSKLGAVFAGELKIRAEKEQRADTLLAQSDWMRETQESIINARRESPENDSNYYERVEADITNRENEFISKLPVNLRSEFRTRVSIAGDKFREQEFVFNNTKKDAYYTRRSLEGLNTGKQQVSEDFTEYETVLANQREFIESTNLSDLHREKSNPDIELQRGPVAPYICAKAGWIDGCANAGC